MRLFVCRFTLFACRTSLLATHLHLTLTLLCCSPRSGRSRHRHVRFRVEPAARRVGIRVRFRVEPAARRRRTARARGSCAVDHSLLLLVPPFVKVLIVHCLAARCSLELGICLQLQSLLLPCFLGVAVALPTTAG